VRTIPRLKGSWVTSPVMITFPVPMTDGETVTSPNNNANAMQKIITNFLMQSCTAKRYLKITFDDCVSSFFLVSLSK